jgi:hypothetical protein
MIKATRLLFSFCLLVITTSYGQTSRSGDLSTYVDSVISSMPGSGTNQYIIPTSSQGTKWESVISKIISRNYSDANKTASSLGYRVVLFTDVIAPSRTYAVLEKKTTASNYWGTYIFNSTAQRSNLVIQSPHPRYDTNTDKEGFYIFKNVSAYAFCLAGTHRCNSSTFSTCSGTTDACGTTEAYRISDIAHEVSGMFQHTTKQILSAKPSGVFIQVHGFAKGSGDPDVILGNGTNSVPSSPNTDYLLNLKNNLYAVDNSLTFKVAHVDVSWTKLTGTTNTQGRYINGVSSPCNTAASTPNGRFLHMEQAYTGLRDNSTGWQKVATAIANTFAAARPASEEIIHPSTELFSFYPNPVSGSLTLLSAEWTNAECRIVDLVGKQVLFRNVSFDEGEISLNVSDLKPGAYFLQLRSGNQYSVQRFIKQ